MPSDGSFELTGIAARHAPATPDPAGRGHAPSRGRCARQCGGYQPLMDGQQRQLRLALALGPGTCPAAGIADALRCVFAFRLRAEQPGDARCRQAATTRQRVELSSRRRTCALAMLNQVRYASVRWRRWVGNADAVDRRTALLLDLAAANSSPSAVQATIMQNRHQHGPLPLRKWAMPGNVRNRSPLGGSEHGFAAARPCDPLSGSIRGRTVDHQARLLPRRRVGRPQLEVGDPEDWSRTSGRAGVALATIYSGRGDMAMGRPAGPADPDRRVAHDYSGSFAASSGGLCCCRQTRHRWVTTGGCRQPQRPLPTGWRRREGDGGFAPASPWRATCSRSGRRCSLAVQAGGAGRCWNGGNFCPAAGQGSRGCGCEHETDLRRCIRSAHRPGQIGRSRADAGVLREEELHEFRRRSRGPVRVGPKRFRPHPDELQRNGRLQPLQQRLRQRALAGAPAYSIRTRTAAGAAERPRSQAAANGVPDRRTISLQPDL